MSRVDSRLRMLEHMMMSMQCGTILMPRVERTNVTYNGHTVQIFKDHTGEPKYYFRCKHCGTEYRVWESDCKRSHHYSGERSTTHQCPRCGTNNNGYTGYRNGYGHNGYMSSDCD